MAALPIHFLSPFPLFPSSKPTATTSLCFLNLRHRPRPILLHAANAAPPPSPADDDPPEAPEDSSHGVSRLQQFDRYVARKRKTQEEEFDKDKPLFISALESEPTPSPHPRGDGDDDPFGDIDAAIALKKQEFISQGLIKPPPPQDPETTTTTNIELSAEEAVDVQEIDRLQSNAAAAVNSNGSLTPSLPFDVDLDTLDSSTARILEPEFAMTLAELLDESRVVPLSVYGDLELPVSGVQTDSREVGVGDLFVTGDVTSLAEAGKRGAVAVVTDKEIGIDETLGCKALVVVEDVGATVPLLAAAFYRHPSRSLAVIGVTGTNGKTTTTHLVKAIYEAMGLRTGMLGTLGFYIHGQNRLEPTGSTPEAVFTQRLMAQMVHNGTDAVVMEASSQGLADGRCDEIDFDIAVFTTFMRDQLDFHGTEEEYKRSMGKLFAKMVDPERHRKVVNIDDPSASYFIAQGNPDVPLVTYAMEDKNADVRPLKFELSLFETQILVQTPQGILEISSGLLGRHNIYNILAAVAVGIAVGAPLEDIVRGIEEIDVVPGRFELIDEEQAFAVVVDHAHTPDALSRVLDAARELGPRRVITVFGCCGERDRGKRPLMTKIATEKSDVVMLTSDNPRNEDPLDILDDMLSGIGWTMQDYLKHGENDYYPPLPNGHRLFLHDIRRVAVRASVAMGEEGDIVIVAGKGHETYQIEGDKKEFFDDREECREALHYVDELHQAGIDTSEFPWRLPESH
ncbi:uncharacterized protein M6B38_123745 [Iris pallida]|uniref:UDP-N-acetylmuramoyl-L-alanyl-D-glutamate--2,6-diaminopimelate ligase MurE homolog, chloroplastic n=1 Tax=Iris pallida TaxID=29817 RepID=A0AAX6H246_IRIPA|nr:uncharacterized protein M6B38_123745 [Iris pallida]